MNRKLFESIRQGVKASQGEQIFETTTGRSTRSVSIAKDWLQGLKDIIQNKADALDVVRETQRKIDTAIEGGDYSDIYAQIQQQMPDTTDLGLIAANMESIEKWLNQDSVPPRVKGEGLEEQQTDEIISAAINAAGNIAGGAVKGAEGIAKGVAGGAKKAVSGVAQGCSNAANNASEGQVNELISKAIGGALERAGNAVGNVAQGAGGAVGGAAAGAGAGVGKAVGGVKRGVQNAVAGATEGLDESYSVTNINKPPKVNTAADSPEIEKTKIDYSSETDFLSKNSHGTVADSVLEFFTNETGAGDAGEVDLPEEGEDMSGGDDSGADEEYVDAYEIFVDEDGDAVYYNEIGELYYATPDDLREAGVDEDVIINMYGQDGPGAGMGGEEPPMEEPPMPPEAAALPPPPQAEAPVDPAGGAPAGPPQDAAPQSPGQMGAGGQPPQGGEEQLPPPSPMDVELVNNGATGEVDKVIINAGGKRIEIGPDGNVIEQPLGESYEEETADIQRPQYSSLTKNIMSFFGESADYKTVARKSPKTAVGGEIPGGIDYVDPKALNAMNRGDDINGSKRIKEGEEDSYNYITLARGLGRSIRVPKGRIDSATFENFVCALNEEEDKEVAQYMKGLKDNDPVKKLYLKAKLNKERRQELANVLGHEGLNESVNENDMVDSHATKGGKEANTPDAFYNLQSRDFKGSPASAKDREKPDQRMKGRTSEGEESIYNTSAFRYMTKGIHEDWRAGIDEEQVEEKMNLQVMQDMEAQDGVNEDLKKKSLSESENVDEGGMMRFFRKFHPRNLTAGGRALSRDLNAIDREDEVEQNRELNQAKYNSAISKLRLQQSKNFNPLRSKGYRKQMRDAGNVGYHSGPQGDTPKSFGPGIKNDDED